MAVVQSAESLGSAQQHTGPHAVPAEEVQELVGEQAIRGAVAFAEIGGELETVVVQRISK